LHLDRRVDPGAPQVDRNFSKINKLTDFLLSPISESECSLAITRRFWQISARPRNKP
jgi:hypothetical protein